MACTKTGAHIYLEPYGEWLYGDAFEICTVDPDYIMELSYNGFLEHVKDVAYFRLVARSFTPINGLTVKHYTIHDFENWFDMGDIESALNNSVLITNNFTNHGRSGEPL